MADVAAALGVPFDARSEPLTDTAAPAPRLSADEVRRLEALARVMRHWRFGGSRAGVGLCLRESLIGGHYLRDRQPVMRIGAKPDGSSVIVHAWIEVSGIPSGGEGFSALSMVAPGER